MNTRKPLVLVARYYALFALFLGCAFTLGACSSNKVTTQQPKQELRVLWTTNLGNEINYPASLSVVNGQVSVATSNGYILLLNIKDGSVVWKIKVKGSIGSGTGFDGTRVAAVTQDNELVVIEGGKIIWQQNLTAQSFTAPVVAGLRVFVLLADRSVVAFDGATGKKLWTQQRPGDALVLKQDGVLMPFHNTLIAGLGARLSGLDPLTGKILWETALATPRGINDLERLVDLVGPAARVGDVICTRAFQSQIGCIDADQGKLIWTRPSFGEEGVSASENQMVSVESNGQMLAWSLNNGDRLWDKDSFKSHHMTAPLIASKGIFIGDAAGWVYLLSKTDGSVINRLPIGSSRGFASPPTAIDSEHMIIVTKNGVISQYYTP